jgi:hypothetical protein
MVKGRYLENRKWLRKRKWLRSKVFQKFSAHHIIINKQTNVRADGRETGLRARPPLRTPSAVRPPWGQKSKANYFSDTAGRMSEVLAVEHDSLQQFFGNFASYCSYHQPVQAPLARLGGPVKLQEAECGVCLDSLEEVVGHATLWTPAAGPGYTGTASSGWQPPPAATTSKCPVCNNKDEFTEEMKEFGIYVLDQDAEPNHAGHRYLLLCGGVGAISDTAAITASGAG